MSFSLCFQTFDGIDIKLLVFLKESDLFFSAQAFATNIFKSVTEGRNLLISILKCKTLFG